MSGVWRYPDTGQGTFIPLTWFRGMQVPWPVSAVCRHPDSCQLYAGTLTGVRGITRDPKPMRVLRMTNIFLPNWKSNQGLRGSAKCSSTIRLSPTIHWHYRGTLGLLTIAPGVEEYIFEFITNNYTETRDLSFSFLYASSEYHQILYQNENRAQSLVCIRMQTGSVTRSVHTWVL